jgi:hypothetical protein
MRYQSTAEGGFVLTLHIRGKKHKQPKPSQGDLGEKKNWLTVYDLPF